MPSEVTQEFVDELRGSIEGWKERFQGDWTQAIARDVDAALEAVQKVVRGHLLPEDAVVVVKRRLEAAAWTTVADAEGYGKAFAADVAQMLIKVLIKAVITAL